MTDKLQKRLDQETLSPVFAVFLMILLRISGLFDGFADSELKIDRIKANPEDMEIPQSPIPAMDRAVGTDLSVAIRQAMVAGEAMRTSLGERFMDAMMEQRQERMRERTRERTRDCDLNVPSAFGNVPEDYRDQMPERVRIDLGSLGTIEVLAPEGAVQLEVNPGTFSMQWRYGDGRLGEIIDLAPVVAPRGRFVHWEHVTGYMDGYCTPSRRPMTGQLQPNDRAQLFHNEGRSLFGGPEAHISRHVGPVRVGIDLNGRSVVMNQNGELNYVPCGERGEGPG